MWFLTEDGLYFVLNLDGGDPDQVEFIDISDDLEIDVVPGSQLAVDVSEMVYIATPYNVTLLECAGDPKFT